MRFRYLSAPLCDASIILMFGNGARFVKIRASSERKFDVILMKTYYYALFQTRILNLLPLFKKLILRTLNYKCYTNIIEQSLMWQERVHAWIFLYQIELWKDWYCCFNLMYNYKVIKNLIDTIFINFNCINKEL